MHRRAHIERYAMHHASAMWVDSEHESDDRSESEPGHSARHLLTSLLTSGPYKYGNG